MRKSVIAGLALWAAFAGSAGKTHADENYPWCLLGDTRGYECVFSSREQCAQDGRNRGFGGQCIQNPFYKPGAPSVSGRKQTETARPSQTVSAAHQRRFSFSCNTGDIPTTVYVGGEVSKACSSAGWGGGGGNPCAGNGRSGGWRVECRPAERR
jgi:Protein of unknown function (DUF3551)